MNKSEVKHISETQEEPLIVMFDYVHYIHVHLCSKNVYLIRNDNNVRRHTAPFLEHPQALANRLIETERGYGMIWFHAYCYITYNQISFLCK